MSKFQAWISAMRLRTLPLSLSGIVAGSAVAYYQKIGDGVIFGLAILTTILFQIVSNFANDLGDGVKGTDNEGRIGPDRMVQSGLISAKQMKSAVIVTSIFSLLSAAALIYFGTRDMPSSMILFYGILALLCVAAAITYTVGKKAYGYYGLGDLMVFIFFGLVSVLGVYSLYAKAFYFENVLLASTFGLLSTAVLNLNNMRDFVGDSKSGKNTLVVKMGPNSAKLYHAMLIIGALVSMSVYIGQFHEPILFLALVPSLVLFVHLRIVMQTKNPKDFDPQLKVVALGTFAIALTFLGLMIFMGNHA